MRHSPIWWGNGLTERSVDGEADKPVDEDREEKLRGYASLHDHASHPYKWSVPIYTPLIPMDNR